MNNHSSCNNLKDHNQNLKTKTSLYLDDFDSIDFAIFNGEFLQGQSYNLSIKVTGKLDANGFICDFSILKKSLKTILKDHIDHKFIISSNQVESCDYIDNQIKLCFKNQNTPQENWQYQAPIDSILSINSQTLSIKIIENYIKDQLTKTIKDQYAIDFDELNIFLTAKQYKNSASFYYTHGITHHTGHCQRLWHGHHSKLEVFLKDKQSPELQDYLLNFFGKNHYFHLANKAQLLEDSSDWPANTFGKANTYCRLKYLSYNQQNYYCKIPANYVLMMEDSTSIETLSNALFKILLKKTHKSLHKDLKLKVSEGINKGAIICFNSI